MNTERGKKGQFVRRYTDEQYDFIRINAEGKGPEALAKAFNQQFGTNISRVQAKSLRDNLRVASGLPPKFPRNNRKVGAVWKGKGKTLVKVSKESGKNYNKNWIPKSRAIWERKHGPLPAKHKILHLDGNKNNYNIDNLIAVPYRSIPLVHNTKAIIPDRPDLSKAMITAIDLLTLANQKQRESKKKQQSNN